ncbi:WD40 repeat-like protein [Dichomitus squalens]|uniref:WD40 repeat-like protein n=1 Tax=Dichomitus squalens TaxID=114155 RepID=A0A4V2K206_9APHY|nr:WD40 repeat-like protein [Dichomitus squalens]
MVDPFHITADEINCLIYSYFKDSGFAHSAFVLRAEGRLEHSPHYRKHVPRGELVELLSKALLFSEVEAHWKGNAMTMSCTNQFRLLEPHTCSFDPKFPPPPLPDAQRHHVHPERVQPLQAEDENAAHAGVPQADGSLKRKASGTPSVDEPPKEKRARTNGQLEDEVEIRSPSVVESITSAVPATPATAAAEEAPASNDMIRTASNETAASEPSEQQDDAVQLLEAHKAAVFVCGWNPVHHTILASGSKDSIVHIWDIPGPDKDGVTFAKVQPPLTCAYTAKGSDSDLTSLTWSNDGSLIAVGCYDSVLRICDSEGKAYFTHTQHDKGPIFAVRFSPSGRWFLSASLDGSACIWDVKEKKLHRQFSLHRQCCLDADWISDLQFVTSGSDARIYVNDLDSQKPLRTLLGHQNEINQVKCNPSKTRLASCSDDMTGRIWNIENVDPLRHVQDSHSIVLEGHTGPVSHIVWSPITPSGEHELVATSSFDGTSRIWDSVTGECLCSFDDHKKNVYALAFSPDGRHIATAGGDGCLHIYDIRAKEKRWSWNAGTPNSSIFEIEWQQSGNLNRIAMAMEKTTVGVVDLTKVPELQ